MRDVGLHKMWIDFLLVGMIEFLEQYYNQIGSKKSAKHWASSKHMTIAECDKVPNCKPIFPAGK